MAKIAKSKDTKNFRKGNALQVGDKIARFADGAISHYEEIVSIERVTYAGAGRNYKVTTTSEFTKVVAGNEFCEGQY